MSTVLANPPLTKPAPLRAQGHDTEPHCGCSFVLLLPNRLYMFYAQSSVEWGKYLLLVYLHSDFSTYNHVHSTHSPDGQDIISDVLRD